MSVDEIRRRLEDRFALLLDPTSRRPDRQRALEAAADVIGRLADRSLVAVEFPSDGGAARYRPLESIGAFALARLHDAGLDEIALRAQVTNVWRWSASGPHRTAAQQGQERR